MGEVLFVDRDREIRDMVFEIKDALRDFNLQIATSLEEAYEILQGRNINGIIVDGMFKVEDLLAFLTGIKRKTPDFPIIVLVVEVDMIIDNTFKSNLETMGVRIEPKIGVFEKGRMKELLAWCCKKKEGM